MRKLIILIICTVLFCACATTKPNMIGNFSGKYPWLQRKHFHMELRLKADSSFEVQSGSSIFTGKWDYKNEKNIHLYFDRLRDGVPIALIGSIIDTRDRTIKVINKNKLEYGKHARFTRVK